MLIETVKRHEERLKELTGKSLNEFLKIEDSEIDRFIENNTIEVVLEVMFIIERIQYNYIEGKQEIINRLTQLKAIFENSEIEVSL